MLMSYSYSSDYTRLLQLRLDEYLLLVVEVEGDVQESTDVDERGEELEEE